MTGLPDNGDVQAWATLIRDSLSRGESVIYNFDCRDNWTRYTLIFTPLAEAEGNRVPGTDNLFVLVSWERRGAYPFRLREPVHYIDVTYVMEKFECNMATAQPLTDLFNAITGADALVAADQSETDAP